MMGVVRAKVGELYTTELLLIGIIYMIMFHERLCHFQNTHRGDQIGIQCSRVSTTDAERLVKRKGVK